MSNQNNFIIENGILKKYSGNNDVVTVPEGVVVIGGSAFSRRKNLRRVIIPNSVEKIESFLEALKSAFRKKVYDIAFKGAK